MCVVKHRMVEYRKVHVPPISSSFLTHVTVGRGGVLRQALAVRRGPRVGRIQRGGGSGDDFKDVCAGFRSARPQGAPSSGPPHDQTDS